MSPEREGTVKLPHRRQFLRLTAVAAVLKARFADLGSRVLPGSPTDFGKLIADDTEKWAKVVKYAGIKAD
jgi:hypothetical protein